MGRVLVFAYGLVAYAVFFVVFVYLAGFLAGVVVPKTVDDGLEGSAAQAIIINTLLMALFGVHHSIAARPGFKKWLTQFVPPPIERSTFVLITSLILALLVWQWRPMPSGIWEVDHPAARVALWALCAVGWATVLYSSFIIDHFDLFGLRQVYLYLRGREYTHPEFMERTLYKLIRHPLLLGFMIAFWATPIMTAGHLLFAILATVYILIGVQFEERSLSQLLGEDYDRYCRRTRRFLPLPKKGAPETSELAN